MIIDINNSKDFEDYINTLTYSLGDLINSYDRDIVINSYLCTLSILSDLIHYRLFVEGI